MLPFIKRIIRRMNQYARRYCTICSTAFILLFLGGFQPLYYLNSKWYQMPISVLLWSLALIFLITAIITFTYDTKTTFRKRRLLKILRHLRGYLADMSHLGRDIMAENNTRKQDQLLESFKTLHKEIEGYIKHTIPSELSVWEKPLDNLLAIAIKESIGKLEDIIGKYENLNSE